jgi:hypothetical protein
MDLFYHARHSMRPLPEDLTPMMPTQYLKLPGMAIGSSGVSRAGL